MYACICLLSSEVVVLCICMSLSRQMPHNSTLWVLQALLRNHVPFSPLCLCARPSTVLDFASKVIIFLPRSFSIYDISPIFPLYFGFFSYILLYNGIFSSYTLLNFRLTIPYTPIFVTRSVTTLNNKTSGFNTVADKVMFHSMN